MILSYQDDDGVHKDNTFGGETGASNENMRFSLLVRVTIMSGH